MKSTILAKIVPFATGLILLAGCVVETPAPPGPPPGPPPDAVVVPPPAPSVSVVWIPGGWDWRGRWVWVNGYYGRPPRPGAVWVGGGWAYHGNRRVWMRGHWH